MGCSIKPQYQQIIKPANQSSQIIVQPGNFVKENKNNFQSIYRIGKLLGTGRFGEVRICTHRTLGLKRAVKIIRKDLLTSAQDRENLDKEINILKSLDHPNIIRVYEFFEEVKRLYIVMEYCAGGELFSQIVKKKHFSESHASNIMKQIFLTLEYLQTQQIVHKDLKPENILLEDKTTAMSIKIIDFGAAEINRSESMIKGNIGTVYYIAPEVLQGNFSFLSDTWSAGVILYIMLCGYPPFDGKNNEEIIQGILLCNYNFLSDPWPSVSDLAKNLIKKLLCAEEFRISPKEALENEWIQQNSTSVIHDSVLTQVLVNLKNFQSASVLKEAIKTFIFLQYLSAHDIKDLKDVFISLDKDHDGKISYQELMNEYTKIMDENDAEILVKKVIKQVDLDMNGFIDYSEFLKANFDTRQLMSEKNLKATFDMFDVDGNGKVNAAEIKRLIGGENNIDINSWNEVIKEFDVNGDGEIDINEFSLFLKTITQTNL